MNETPRDPQQPDHASGDAFRADDPAPRDPARSTDASADASADATTRLDAAPAANEAPRRGRGVLKPVLIGSAAALTVLAVGVGGLAIADAVGDDDDEPRPSMTAAAPSDGAADPSASDEPGDLGSTAAPDATAVPSASAAPGAGAGATGESDALVAAIDAAIAAAGGGAATSIEVERDAWKVDVRLDDGSEVDVRVPVEGEAIVQADDDDRSNELPLETGRIAEISDAAIAAAGGGEVRSIETDDDEVRFEVEVEQRGEDVDVDLADDLAVLSVER